MNTALWDWVAFSLGSTAGIIYLQVKRTKLGELTRSMTRQLEQARKDGPLADWARHMSVTVITNTGSSFSTTFAELHTSEARNFRLWNGPLQVSIWHDQDHDTVQFRDAIDTTHADDARG